MCKVRTLLFSVLLVAFSGTLVEAAITLDPDAIAKESVYPLFPKAEAVKRRAVSLENRLQLGGMVGVARNNAYFDANTATLVADYHFTEEQGVQLYASWFFSDPSSATVALNATNNLENLDLAPEPRFLISLSYKLVPWYGKISLSKSAIYNISLQGNIGPSFFDIGGKFFPGLNVGIGPQFYFKNGWGLAFDFRGLLYSGPDPLSVDLSGFTSAADPDLFDTQFNFNLLMNVAFTKLF